MKVFNIEEKNGKKEYVCYIQLKDIEYLTNKGIELETANDVNNYIYVFSKATLKSFVRVSILNDVIKIRENSDEIIDLGKALANDLSVYDEEIEKEEKDMKESMDRFWSKCNGFYKGHLKDDDAYNEWREKGIRLKNKLEDLKDIREITLGESKVNLPQVPFYNSVLKKVGDYLVHKGINPNEYVVVRKEGIPFDKEIREKIKNYDGTDLSYTIVPTFATAAILKDVNRKYGKDCDMEYQHMINDDNRYLIVRIKNVTKKNKKGMELVK